MIKLADNEDPNLAVYRAWDFQVEKSHKELLFWRVSTILTLGLLIILFGFTLYHISSPRFIPYVVEVEDGKARFAGMVESQKVTLNDALIRNNLNNFILKTRLISTDLVATKRNLADAYFMSTEASQSLITSISAELLDLSSKGNTHRDVVFEVFESLGENSYRVQWREDTRQDGLLTEQKKFSGVFNFITDTPTTAMAVEKNPLGFFITSFNIQELR